MPNVVLNKIQTIERCLKRIREEYTGYEEELENNYTKQDSVILNLERAPQAAIDITTHIVKAKSSVCQTPAENFSICSITPA